MTGAIFCESRPATIIKSACRGEGRNTSALKRATSNRAAAMDIISIAQHARPSPSVQIELLRAQFTALSSVVKMMPSSSSNLPKSSGLVSVTCLPNDVLIDPRLHHFRTRRSPKQTLLLRVAQPILAVRLAPQNAFRLIIPPMSGSPSQLPPSPHLRLHCVNVFVRDQDRSLRFFVDQLGFHVAYDTRLQSGDRWVAVAPPDGSAILSLVVPKPNSEQHKLIGRSTTVVFVTEDVTSKFLQCSQRGVRFSTPPRLKRIRYQSQAQAAAAAAYRDPAAPDAACGASAPASRSTGMRLAEETPVGAGVSRPFRDIHGHSSSPVSSHQS